LILHSLESAAESSFDSETPLSFLSVNLNRTLKPSEFATYRRNSEEDETEISTPTLLWNHGHRTARPLPDVASAAQRQQRHRRDPTEQTELRHL
jgi:hypothetical protein